MTSFDHVFVDGKNLLFRTTWSNQALTHGGVCTGGIFGFLRTLLTVHREFGGPTIHVCWEGRRNWRFRAYPAYKGNRSKGPRDGSTFNCALEVHNQLSTLQVVLTDAGIGQWRTDDGECDDVMYSLSKEYSSEGFRTAILTQDRDLYQVTAMPFCYVLRADNAGGWEVVGPQRVVEETGIQPHQIAWWKALAGDSSDNIPGVGRIGPKTAAKLLGEGTLEDLLTAGRTGVGWPGTPAQRTAVMDAEDLVRVYADIVTLRDVPCDCTVPEAPDLPALQAKLDALGMLTLSSEPEISTLCMVGGMV